MTGHFPSGHLPPASVRVRSADSGYYLFSAMVVFGEGYRGEGQMSCYREGSDCAADDKQCTAELLLLAPTMTPALHHLSLIQSDRGLLYNSIRGSVV